MAACVTRILELRGFDSRVKTRDVQAAFADFGESPKIKWINDNSLYLVFSDAITGKESLLAPFATTAYDFCSKTGLPSISRFYACSTYSCTSLYNQPDPL